MEKYPLYQESQNQEDVIEDTESQSSSLESAPEGWKSKSAMSKEMDVSYGMIKRIAESFSGKHNEWFREYKNPNGHLTTYYSPELVEEIRKEITEHTTAPEGWKTAAGIKDDTGISAITIKKFFNRDPNPEFIRQYKSGDHRPQTHYSPEFIKLIINDKRGLSPAPEGWLTVHSIAKGLNIDHMTIKKMVDRLGQDHPEWFKDYLDKGSRRATHLSPELIKILNDEVSKFEEIPDGWNSINSFSKEIGKDFSSVKRQAFIMSNGDNSQIRKFKTKQMEIECISNDLMNKIIKHFSETRKAPDGWKTNKDIVKLTGSTKPTIATRINYLRESHPEWIGKFESAGGHRVEYYSPELVEVISKELTKFDRSPIGWNTKSSLSKEFKVNIQTIEYIVNEFRNLYPEWFKEYRGQGGVFEHYSPELVEIIKSKLSERKNENKKLSNEQLREEELVKFLDDLDNSLEGKKFKSLVGLFGSSNVIDLLYVTHPHFKDIPVHKIKSVIAEYLGNFILSGAPFCIEDLEGNFDCLKVENLKSGLIEVIKNHCLNYYLLEKKGRSHRTDTEIFNQYFIDLFKNTEYLNSEDLQAVISEVKDYYDSIFHLTKGDNMVDSVKEGRSFPDVYQRINVREVGNKKRLLIADEMGVGKSASAILSKELLGVETALLVVPSNVIDTWKNYLSDKVDENGRQRGYFKTGEAPRVFIVDDIEDITKISEGEYDYVLISQERLSDKYAEALKSIEYGMLIVDEVHKFKNIQTGKRSEKLIELAKKVEGEDQYLVLLSGTPVPNKIEDVALLLKLLHPERFSKIDSKTLVANILDGNLSDIRSLLVPHMQRKDLKDHVEMPNLEEKEISIPLNQLEQDIYQVLLEEDELTPTQKLSVLRRFLMNHQGLDATPDIPSHKIEIVSQELKKAFKDKTKVIFFVNDYVDGVITGDNTIIPQLNLPDDVEVRVVHGQVPQEERLIIQNEFNSSNKKILLMVSGQTAGVGVDYTGGEQIYFYNEPWTKADADQQKARVFRPGVKHDLKSETFITENTIEEGIHRYIELKHRAIKKLLDGIPITEFEREFLEKNERSNSDNLEVNAELADYYFSAFDKMNKIFASVKEMGEKNFLKFLDRHGSEYADCYMELGSRSYQANASRVCATLIESMVKERKEDFDKLKIIDIASGPEMLRRHSSAKMENSVTSADININHFIAKGTKNAVIAGFTDLPFENGEFDYANLSLAFHYSKFLPSRGEYERARVLNEVSRVLKDGGRALINMIYSLEFRDLESFKDIASKFGLDLVEDYSGEINVDENYVSRMITLEKKREPEASVEEIIKSYKRQDLGGLKLRKKKINLKDPRKVINSFELNGRVLNIDLNNSDKKVVHEEKSILEIGDDLKNRYGSIANIPKDEIINNNFIRILVNKKYILFRKLSQGGAVIIK